MKKAKIFLISILTTFCLYSERIIKELSLVFSNLKDFNFNNISEFSYTNMDFLLIFILTIALMIFYHKLKDVKKYKAYNILSLILSLFLIFGFSYNLTGNYSLVFGNFLIFVLSCLKLFAYYQFLSTTINYLTMKLKNYDFKKLKVPKFLKKFCNYYEIHPYKTTILFLLIAWLPYIISFYPGVLSPDPAVQITAYYNLENKYSDNIDLIDSNVLLTNHHPVFHTFILGGFTRIGDMLGNINFGLFLFIVFQLFVVITSYANALVYLKKLKTPLIFQLIILFLFAFVPVFPLYSICFVKDIFFGALLLFLIIEFHKLLTNNNYKLVNYITLSLLILFMMLVRNNGIYIILLSFIPLILIVKTKKLPLILVLISSLSIYYIHNNVLLPAWHITGTSIREALSVPIQQTARLVKYHEEDVSEADKKVINKLLNYDGLAENYEANIADPVKDEFKKGVTKKDINAYFCVWFKGLLKHPGVYINATVNTVYGYFYPNTSNWYIYHNYNKILPRNGFDFHFNKLKWPRIIIENIAVSYPYIPVLGAQVNIGFNTWIYLYLLAFLIHEHQKKLLPLILPALALLLTYIVGPVNTYFRYILPLVMSLPILIGLIYQSVVANKTQDVV